MCPCSLEYNIQRNNTVGAAKVSKSKATTVTATASASVEKKTEHPADPCRDPITLDDLGSWTWDFRASEAATPPVSCGGPSFSKNGGEVSKGGGSGGGSSSGLWGRGRRCEGGGGKGGGKSGSGGSSSAVVTYNVESLVLYLLESGDFQVWLSVKLWYSSFSVLERLKNPQARKMFKSKDLEKPGLMSCCGHGRNGDSA